MKTEEKYIGERIKKAREEAHLTQSQIHEITGISITEISNYENGRRNIGLENLAKIARATHKTIDDLYFGTYSEKPILISKNEGELVANCVEALVDLEVLDFLPRERYDFLNHETSYVYELSFAKYSYNIEDLVKKLLDFKKNKENYTEPEIFKKQLIKACANGINKEIK